MEERRKRPPEASRKSNKAKVNGRFVSSLKSSMAMMVVMKKEGQGRQR